MSPAVNFIGIDQTGAISSSGKPKRLPVCVLQNNRIQLFYLPKFSEELLDFKPSLICIDCVLGLPVTVGLTLRNAIALTKVEENFGRRTAQIFFNRLAAGQSHNRKIESQIGANSVFTIHPFQKNIQTGTFRFWKEMADSPNWFYLPAIPGEKQKKQSKIPVVEGYPSIYWKLILNQKSRMPNDTVRLLRLYFPNLRISRGDQKKIQKDPNFSDAILLALAAQKFHAEIQRKSHPEGWILGVR